MTFRHHTPGDWLRNGNQVIAAHSDEDGEHETLICEVFDQHDCWRANARLITAASRMLAALVQAEPQLTEYCSGDDGKDIEAHLVLREIRDAITKATGRTV